MNFFGHEQSLLSDRSDKAIPYVYAGLFENLSFVREQQHSGAVTCHKARTLTVISTAPRFMRFVKNEESESLMKDFSTTCRNSNTDY
jgi:hypothetical protein